MLKTDLYKSSYPDGYIRKLEAISKIEIRQIELLSTFNYLEKL